MNTTRIPRTELKPLAYDIYQNQNVRFETMITGIRTTQLGTAVAYADDYFTVNFEHPVNHHIVTRQIHKADLEGITNDAGDPFIDGREPEPYTGDKVIPARGGKRAGAGRPRTQQPDRKPRTVRITDFDL